MRSRPVHSPAALLSALKPAMNDTLLFSAALAFMFVFASSGWSETMDFESPQLGPQERGRIINPYVDTATGVVFTTDQAPSTAVVGLVPNWWTSACVPPDSYDQKLGTGISTDPESVGLGVFYVRATFPTPLPASTTVSVEFQSMAGILMRIRLYGVGGNLVGEGTGRVPDMGTCVDGRPPSGRVTVTATAQDDVAFARLAGATSYVWVADNFTFTAPVRAEESTWGRVKAKFRTSHE